MAPMITMLLLLLVALGPMGQKRHRPNLTKAQAIKVVKEQFQNGVIRSAELERQAGKLAWSFDVGVDSLVKEIWVDARTGKVLQVQDMPPAAEKEQGGDAAEKLALQKIPGEVIRTETKVRKGKKIYVFDIRTRKSDFVEVQVDSAANKVVNIQTLVNAAGQIESDDEK